MATGDLNPQAPPFLQNPIDDISARLSKDFSGLHTGDKTATQNIVDLNLHLLSKVRHFDNSIDDLVAEQKLACTRIRGLERDLAYLNQENIFLRQQLALTEDATGILFLRVEGLFEKNGENLITYVASTLSRTGILCSIDDLDYVKCIGKRKQNSTRPVLVKFIREYKRNLILYNRANLNRNSNSLIWINDDVSDHTRRQRKTVRDIAAYAKTIGQTDLKIHGDGLVVGNGKFKHQDLDLLPEHLSVATAKQPSDETDLYFQSEHSPLSNFFHSPILDKDEIHYTSAEQNFQHKKALFHEYYLTAKKILQNRDPYELKQLGNLVPMSQDWKDTEEDTMTDILRSKFLQNPNLLQILVSTGSLHLHEASADQKWSTGAELASKALQIGSWPGQDRMGFLLEKLRAEFLGINFPEQENPLPEPSPSLPAPLGDDLLPMPQDDEDDHDPDPTPSPASHHPSSPQTHPLTQNQPLLHAELPAPPPASPNYTQAHLSQERPILPSPHP